MNNAVPEWEMGSMRSVAMVDTLQPEDVPEIIPACDNTKRGKGENIWVLLSHVVNARVQESVRAF